MYVSGVALGKKEAKPDQRNLLFAKYAADIKVPSAFDFEKGKTPYPFRSYGNTQWGDCVIASEAAAGLRFERKEQRRTIDIADPTVVARYLRLSGGQDTGLYELDGLNDWRVATDMVDAKNRSYTIDAFTMLHNDLGGADPLSIKRAIFLGGVIKMCFALPATAQQQDIPAMWDATGGLDGNAAPWSWGGHSMSADGFDSEGVWLIHTWGIGRQKATWAFVKAYCDEAYSIIDSVNAWKKKHGVKKFDTKALAKDVREVTERNVA